MNVQRKNFPDGHQFTDEVYKSNAWRSIDCSGADLINPWCLYNHTVRTDKKLKRKDFTLAAWHSRRVLWHRHINGTQFVQMLTLKCGYVEQEEKVMAFQKCMYFFMQINVCFLERNIWRPYFTDNLCTFKEIITMSVTVHV